MWIHGKSSHYYKKAISAGTWSRIGNLINNRGLEFDHMLCDLSRTSKTGKENTDPVVKGLFYNILVQKKHENVKLINFTPDVIVPNEPLDEMEMIRKKSFLTWQHLLKELISNRMVIRWFFSTSDLGMVTWNIYSVTIHLNVVI